MPKYKDKNGKIINLGSEIAQGGEGIVYNYNADKSLVAKIYKKDKRSSRKGKKIELMSKLYDKDIAKFSAWVKEVIYENQKPVGFLMEKISDYKEIHLLYGRNEDRQKYFPNAEWKFLVHAALNTARAVGTLHDKGIVIGDINQSNILVNDRAEIKLIDCDSYQIKYKDSTYICEVGVPEFTSPELQGCSFKTITRNQNHDCFGLAVMIFKILLLAKHPYSGCNAPSEIENAIKGNYFCYSKKYKYQTPVYSALVKYLLNDEIIDLFERAFCNSKSRPTAKEWIKVLEKFENSDVISCTVNNKHYYNKKSKKCVWCELEKKGINHFGQIKPNNVLKNIKSNTKRKSKKKTKQNNITSKKQMPTVTATTGTKINTANQTICHNCSAYYPSILNLCPYCGCDTTLSFNEICPVCGNLYSDSLEVCPTCGYTPTGTTTTTCSVCGNFYASYLTNDCPICGGGVNLNTFNNSTYSTKSSSYSKSTQKPVVNTNTTTTNSTNNTQSSGQTLSTAEDVKNVVLFLIVVCILMMILIPNLVNESKKEDARTYRQNNTYERNNYYDNSVKEAVVEPTYKEEPVYNPEPVHEEQQSSETKPVQQVQPPQNTTNQKQANKDINVQNTRQAVNTNKTTSTQTSEHKKTEKPNTPQKPKIDIEKETKNIDEYLFE